MDQAHFPLLLKTQARCGDQGFSLLEILILLPIATVLLYLASQVMLGFSNQNARYGQASDSAESLLVPLQALKNDLKRATAVTYAPLQDSITISTGVFDSGTDQIVSQTILYALSTSPCPQFGAGMMCKSLTRTAGSGPPLQFTGLADFQWCLYDSSVASPTPFDDCSLLPFARLPGAPVVIGDKMRMGLSFGVFSSIGSQAKRTLNSIIALDGLLPGGDLRPVRLIRRK